ncbi:hypothetical protein [Pantoea allii]|uniref:hypothetical protein n=1 Tax=Pantoea allii TaxID=574096 RepID=UPI001301CC02|nr:hypothetical protein [Pantoea allii]MBW1252023.1 hypothetical protein [Pantoea allii]MBW1263860.1 hypothetical protein [Pantoea allii]MBW1286312.1 hypothetical protein [Pantoea allii]NQS87250.1 hypothetical protein [Pantoea allii]
MAYGERLNQPDIPPQVDELRGYFRAQLTMKIVNYGLKANVIFELIHDSDNKTQSR